MIFGLEKYTMLDTNTIFVHASKIDESIGMDTNIEIVCDRCGKSNEVRL